MFLVHSRLWYNPTLQNCLKKERLMRGTHDEQHKMYSYVSPESRIPKDHPLRPIKKMVHEAFKELSPQFSVMYSSIGRPSIAPERILKALILQFLYSIRSERMLIEQIDYNLLFRWFVGLAMDDPVWDPSTFSKNRDRLIGAEVSIAFLKSVRKQAQKAGLLSDEHFSVDGTLIEAWASMKSFRPKDEPPPDPPEDGASRNPEIDFHGEKRTNKTHQSLTDPDSRLYKKAKGKEARLSFMAHALMENRSGLVLESRVSVADGRAERVAALGMLKRVVRRKKQISLGADSAYDSLDFINELRALNVTPHIAPRRGDSAAAYIPHDEPYRISQVFRKRIEEVFGWIKTVGVLRKTRHRGQKKVDWMFTLGAAVYNLVRMRRLAGWVPG
jgi:transposase